MLIYVFIYTTSLYCCMLCIVYSYTWECTCKYLLWFSSLTFEWFSWATLQRCKTFRQSDSDLRCKARQNTCPDPENVNKNITDLEWRLNMKNQCAVYFFVYSTLSFGNMQIINLSIWFSITNGKTMVYTIQWRIIVEWWKFSVFLRSLDRKASLRKRRSSEDRRGSAATAAAARHFSSSVEQRRRQQLSCS